MKRSLPRLFADLWAAGWGAVIRSQVRHRAILCFLVVVWCGSVTLAAEEPAFATARRMGRGVNILGYDGVWEGGVDAPFRARYFGLIREAGFRHVRINLHGFKYMSASYALNRTALEGLDWAIEQAIANDLIPVIDEHDFTACQQDPEPCASKLMAFWAQLSQRYAGRHPTLVFEVLNEPGGRMTASLWNRLLPGLIRTIREKNPERTIIVPAINSEDPSAVQELKLPAADRNIIVTVHFYKPIAFTHQGAPWSRKFIRTGIDWGTKDDEQELVKHFDVIAAWAKGEGRPIYLGEFGVYERAGMGARVRYTSAVTRAAERHGWPWAYWQFDHDFALFDTAREQWIGPILNALVPDRPNRAKR